MVPVLVFGELAACRMHNGRKQPQTLRRFLEMSKFPIIFKTDPGPPYSFPPIVRLVCRN
jgi:hypothetical protein